MNIPSEDNEAKIKVHRTKRWTNYENNSFYELIKASGLKKLALTGGLSTGCDIELLSSYWQNSQSILEVGAGYGRVIEHLLRHCFSGHITAIERCNTMFNYLQKRYSHQKQVNLLHGDIHDINEDDNFSKKFDLIFWLWSGIADFPLPEQAKMIRKLKSFLKKGGKLIIDTVADTAVPLGTEEKDLRSDYTLKINNATIHMYRASLAQLNQYAKMAGFLSLKHIPYKTTTQRERVLHILG